MKKYFLAVFLLVFLFISKANALLPVGLYFGVRGNQHISADSTNNGYGVVISDSVFSPSVTAGVKLFNFRFELEYMYGLDTGKLNGIHKTKEFDIDTKMLNVYYDFFKFLLLKFYVNAGVGTYDIKTNLVDGDSKMWNIGVGTTFSLLDMINIDFGVRHVNMGRIKYSNGSNRGSFEEIYTGVRFGI